MQMLLQFSQFFLKFKTYALIYVQCHNIIGN